MVTQICSPCLRQVNRINTKPVDVLKDNTIINWEAICNDV